MLYYRDEWYGRDGGIFQDYYDAKSKTLLIFFHGSGKRTEQELKTLYLLADESIQKKSQMDLPVWQQWGYNDEVYSRYISYEQATLGLGRLTNKFPLPAGYETTNANDLEISKFFGYPNPVTDHLQFTTTPDWVEIYDLSGRLLIKGDRTKEIDVSRLVSSMYLIRLAYSGKVIGQKVLKM